MLPNNPPYWCYRIYRATLAWSFEAATQHEAGLAFPKSTFRFKRRRDMGDRRPGSIDSYGLAR
jgi:hypothetical protein